MTNTKGGWHRALEQVIALLVVYAAWLGSIGLLGWLLEGGGAKLEKRVGRGLASLVSAAL